MQANNLSSGLGNGLLHHHGDADGESPPPMLHSGRDQDRPASSSSSHTEIVNGMRQTDDNGAESGGKTQLGFISYRQNYKVRIKQDFVTS